MKVDKSKYKRLTIKVPIKEWETINKLAKMNKQKVYVYHGEVLRLWIDAMSNISD